LVGGDEIHKAKVCHEVAPVGWTVGPWELVMRRVWRLGEQKDI
jgi:hypothetical protein